MPSDRRRIGIVGYGHLGKYLAELILKSDDMEIAFVWNRSKDKILEDMDVSFVLDDLSQFHLREPSLVIEVAHPVVSFNYGAKFLEYCDYLIGSPSALANPELEEKLRSAATNHGLYVPSGAFWGGEDVRRMADRGTLQKLVVTMTKHPSCLKLESPLKEKNEHALATGEPVILYDGAVRGLCPLAPNNVNTMAAACVAGHTLGFDRVQGRLVADPKLTDWHLVQVDAWGPGDIAADRALHVRTERRNPAGIGAVTGTATYGSFASSLRMARGKGSGVHLC